jgi:hypothetical protein
MMKTWIAALALVAFVAPSSADEYFVANPSELHCDNVADGFSRGSASTKQLRQALENKDEAEREMAAICARNSYARDSYVETRTMEKHIP